MAHPRESEEWKNMTMMQRYEVRAPLRRVVLLLCVFCCPGTHFPMPCRRQLIQLSHSLDKTTPPSEKNQQFFAPIWRVMRDDNVTPEEVAEQVAYVALAVKQGSQVSDMRRHAFSGRLKGAQLVFFRANDAGACDYFNDGRCAPVAVF
jgi:hypothetical protein